MLNVDHGSLALVNSTGVTMIDSNGADGTLSFQGSQSAINAVLTKGITYTPTAGFNGDDTLTIGANDGPNSASQQVVIAVTHAVTGTIGNDSLTSTTGNDTIHGGAGDDTLTGLAGTDTFVFQPNSGHDSITDFVPDIDIIQFAASMFADQQAILAATQDVAGLR